MELEHKPSTKNRHLVGVYGTLRLGGSNHSKYMKNAIFVKNQRIKGILIDINGNYPAAVLADRMNDDNPSKILVGNYNFITEIYDISEAELADLDALEGHPNFYERTLVPVQGLGHIWMYNMHYSWLLNGKQDVVLTGDWYTGCKTTVVDFGDGTDKPSIIISASTIASHPNSHMYDDDEDETPWYGSYSPPKKETQTEIVKIQAVPKVKEA